MDSDHRFVTINQACRRCISGWTGRPVSRVTVWRWIRRGVRGVKLEATRVGGSVLISNTALNRFIERLNSSDAGHCSPTHSRGAAIAANRRVAAILDGRTRRARLPKGAP